jgi:3-oxoacyl-[acyl-carrier protein] reductase
MYPDLKGKTALVTASSKGLGKAIAIKLAQDEVNLAICSRSEERIELAAKEIQALTGRKPLTLVADMQNAEDIRHIVHQTVETFGGVDILVTNAGGPPTGKFADFSDEAWHRAHETTLLSVVRIIREVLPHMQKNGGSIVNVTSVSVKQPIAGLLLSNVYRAAVTGLAKTLSEELAPYGIRINNVAPGRIATDRILELDSQKAAAARRSMEEITAEQLRNIPLGRYGTPEEFANVVAFLASSQSSYVTGTTQQVDGGMLKALF